MQKIYLAIPYSHDDAGIKDYRFKTANRYAAMLMRWGYIVFSPISHSHTIAINNKLPVEWSFWEAQDRSFVEWADIIVVICIDGWKESVGVQAEIRLAEELGKQIIYQDPSATLDDNLEKIK